MARKLAAAVFSLGCLHASSVMALGLGELELDSFLNQPLNASVDLLNTGGLHQEEIKVRLATREDFNRLGIERSYFLTNIEFEVVVGSNGSARIVMTSDEPVLEPYLDFVVEARWPTGRLLREYTVLIDPPVFDQSSMVVSASDRVEAVEGIPAPTKKKSGSNRGTQVDLKRSSLAQGEMPRRDFNASTSRAPISGDRYTIAKDDTLWSVASRARPSGTSVHQTMLDIQRLNPNAFINGNINRIKAGYIIYLPNSGDISSTDEAAALAEVREQNAAWREQRDAEYFASKGPSLRISAQPEPGASAEEVAAAASLAAAEAAEAAALDGAAATERLAAVQQQLETLQRIVKLKDEQINALQAALSEADANGDGVDAAAQALAEAEQEAAELESAAAALEAEAVGELADLDSDLDLDAEPGELALVDDQTMDSDLEETLDDDVDAVAELEDQDLEDEQWSEAEETAEEVAAAKPVTKVPAAPKPAPKPKTNWLNYAMYGGGAGLLGLLGFLFVRKRRASQDEDDSDLSLDAFSDVELSEPELDLEAPADDIAGLDTDRDDQVAALEEAETPLTSGSGYGERKHDAYADDVEASDALAEADIYIAYGRHPQAIDLLNNALKNEPNNPIYRLKLIEVYTELGDRGGAAAQLEQLQNLGDAQASMQGEALMAKLDASDDDELALYDSAPADSHVDGGLSPNPLAMDDQSLESEFSELQIEETDEEADLDLSADFADEDDEDDDGEELVIADDANGLSTKMDLARAYLDMGDEDGARQILEEVVAEGSDELRVEAEQLLVRIGG